MVPAPASRNTNLRYALLSVTDKTGLVDFARGLVECGLTLLSTGGTASTLRSAGLPVTDVAEITGSPEILDGRVKTLHPIVHGGILHDRSAPSHLAQILEHRIAPIDVVAVNLYDFAATVVNAARSPEVSEAIKQIDIGGPAMLRAAAKNHQFVLPVIDPADYPRVISELRTGAVGQALRQELAAKTFARVSAYDGMIATWLQNKTGTAEKSSPAGDASATSALPAKLTLELEQIQALRYGENPHQSAGFYRVRSNAGGADHGLATVEVLQGKELSYNNLLDLDAAVQLALDLPEQSVAIIKHTNPCGVATAGSSRIPAAEVFKTALAADPVSAFGGIVAFNMVVDEAAAVLLREIFLEVVAAPGFSAEARTVLAAKKNLRLVDTRTAQRLARSSQKSAGEALVLRSVLGAVLVQTPDLGASAVESWRAVTKLTPTSAQLADLAFANVVGKHVKSNAVVFAAGQKTTAIGAGQMSRVDSVRFAINKAKELGHDLCGSVVASDAFFPFRDNIELLAGAGVAAIVQPGGSVRDDEVIRAADDAGIVMLFSGRRHFRH